MCWGNVSEAEHGGSSSSKYRETLEAVKRELKTAGKLLVCAGAGGEVDFKEELKPLYAVDPGLRELFGTVDDNLIEE